MTARLPTGPRTRPALLLGPVVLLLSLVLPVRPASAHPLDVYLQASYLTLAPRSITVEIDLSPGVLIAPRLLPVLDADGDQAISDGEARNYLGRAVQDAELTVDDQPVPLTLTKIDVPPYLTIQAGYGTLRVFAAAPVSGAPAGAGEHRVFFRNGFFDNKAAYQVNAFLAKRAPVVLGTQQRDPTQRQATISYRVDPGAAASATTTDQGSARSAAPGSHLAGYLQEPSLSVWAVLLALVAAAFLGALHALTPGHAKTLMAAYLVGSGGTVLNAATLAAVVTVTHTASGRRDRAGRAARQPVPAPRRPGLDPRGRFGPARPDPGDPSAGAALVASRAATRPAAGPGGQRCAASACTRGRRRRRVRVGSRPARALARPRALRKGLGTRTRFPPRA